MVEFKYSRCDDEVHTPGIHCNEPVDWTVKSGVTSKTHPKTIFWKLSPMRKKRKHKTYHKWSQKTLAPQKMLSARTMASKNPLDFEGFQKDGEMTAASPPSSWVGTPHHGPSADSTTRRLWSQRVKSQGIEITNHRDMTILGVEPKIGGKPPKWMVYNL